jgi:hypothetical protein
MRRNPVRRKSRPKRHHWGDQPKTGAAGPGETFEPTAIPKERESDDAERGKPRPAPAPGVPLSREEYERLKERARTVRKRPPKQVQEDPSAKK